MRLDVSLGYEVYIKDDVIYDDPEYRYLWDPNKSVPISADIVPVELKDKIRIYIAQDQDERRQICHERHLAKTTGPVGLGLNDDETVL